MVGLPRAGRQAVTAPPLETDDAKGTTQPGPLQSVDTERLAGPAAAWQRWVRIGGALVLVGVLILAWIAARGLPLSEIADRGDLLRSRCRESPVTSGAAAFLILVVSATLSLPIAALLTMSYGWLFGAALGTLIVSFGSTTGSTLAFLASRFFFQRRDRANEPRPPKGWREHLEQNAAWSLFTLRLQPTVPFFLINILMGTTRMRTRTFWWVSQIGMLPLTTLYACAGSQLPGLRQIVERGPAEVLSLPLLVAISLAGLIPWGIRALMRNSAIASRSEV